LEDLDLANIENHCIFSDLDDEDEEDNDNDKEDLISPSQQPRDKEESKHFEIEASIAEENKYASSEGAAIIN
jgi:hypothetical protein